MQEIKKKTVTNDENNIEAKTVNSISGNEEEDVEEVPENRNYPEYVEDMKGNSYENHNGLIKHYPLLIN